jgi:lipid II:glycine glycyltransferase (peptidoglycan interpeptide bridge formation enzyme)
MAFNGVYAVVNEAMKRSLAHGVRRFNMMGFFPDFSRNNGLLEFKKQYNGHIEELVGTYVCDLQPLRFFLARAAGKVRRTLARTDSH